MWKPAETAPFDEDITVLVSDGCTRSLCSSETVPADEGGLGSVGQKDTARGCAFEMDAVTA
jgi:hypothetical protein